MRLLEWAILTLCIYLAQGRYLHKRQANVGVNVTVVVGNETTVVQATSIPEVTDETAETTVAETTVEETTVAETTAAETTVEETTVAETTTAETTVEETTVAETTAAETTVEETTVAETTAAETTAEETTVAETTAAETTVAETTVAETTAAETTVAETTVEETTIAETTVAETTAAETTVAETTVEETTAAETTVAETTVAETTVEETTAAETTVAETTVEETTVAETTAAETTVAETTAAETTAAETTTAELTVVPYGDEPITPKSSYVDEPYAPKYGKPSGYGAGEQGSGSISQGGYSGNIKVEPSGYRRRRANEYGDESLTPPTPPPGGDEEYPPGGEETPAPADQGYGPDLGPPVEPGGYRRKKRQSEYGDENVTPTTISSGDEYAPATEETSAPIDQGYAASEAPPVGPGGYRKKRQSEYGDENVTPSTPVTPGGEESFTEETLATVGQEYGDNGGPPVQPGGYRRRRQSEYGDENVTPSTPITPGGEESFTEETPATVGQGSGCTGRPPVEPGGYRRKRQNEYGDENVTPSTPVTPGGEESFTEETPATVDQGYGCNGGGPPVEPGGYRKKRQSEYGDENVTPSTPVTPVGEESFTEETPATAGQGYGGDGGPPVQPGGYRRRRQSEYGDENVTPSTPVTPGGEESFTEETPATVGQEYGGDGGPPVQPGGYRKKRQSEYGDENVTPSTPVTPGGEESFTEETPATVGQEYGGDGGPPVQPGGYRKKRQSEYGDENVTPSTPVIPGGEESFTEETPATVGQEYGGDGGPPVQAGGYRRRRQSEYGDENVTPSTPATPGGEESFTEETPATVGQEYGGDGGPPVQAGGYRRRRQSEYGDENVTPSTPTTPGGEESFTEETPATVGQEYGGDGGPPVQAGGYRRRRQSEYGDENVTPTTISSGNDYAPATEETSAPIDQGYAASEAPPVGPGGYRKKRQSEYGDENVTPSTPVTPGGEESFTEETPATVGQEYGGDGGPPVQAGGYRRRRQSEYGDENVTPSTPATPGGEESFTEETPATVGQEYGGDGGPPVQAGGYRRRRQSEYGDENVTPSTPATPGGEESFTEETPATVGQEYGGDGGPPVQAGGYRRRRQSEYGDENVTSSTPATPGGEESFTEETPATVGQEYGGDGGPPVQAGGYRRRRQSEYGDENVTPSTPVTPGGEESFTEETPATVGQEYGGDGGPPVQPGGYRKKRQNEYGDENITPSTPITSGGEESFTEETPATVGQGYGCTGRPPVEPGGYRRKRQNEYGDENVTPSTPVTPSGEESFTEETPATVDQGYGCNGGGPPVEPGGYRKKRQSEYGDENVTPSTPVTPGGEESFTEETPATAGQGYGGDGGPPVVPGGYRKRRQSEYGDENVTPSTPVTPGGEESFTEETPATAGQGYGGDGGPPVEPGGYRKRRQSEYGDENVTPSTPVTPGGEESFTEETPATAGQGYGGDGGPPVVPGGYRKRRQSEYGDENVTPSTPVTPGGEESFTEETPATAGQGYGGDEGPPVEPGGYRKKRQSEYGDENVTPTTLSSGDDYAPATEETSAPIDQGYAASEAPPVGPGGYRKKRQSEYGDENVTPSTPITPGGEESFTEETPATIGQGYGGDGGPPVEPGGYRKKRQNEYGDENVTPSTPVTPGGEESFTEETPATAGQGYGCTGRPPVEPGGYRRKRQNEYGDENVTPSTPVTPGGEESFTEETPATVAQGYDCNEGGPPVEPGGYRKKRSSE